MKEILSKLSKLANISPDWVQEEKNFDFSLLQCENIHPSVKKYLTLLSDMTIHPKSADRWLIPSQELIEAFNKWPVSHLLPNGFINIAWDNWSMIFIVHIETGEVYEFYSRNVNDDGYIECEDYPVNYENIIEFTDEKYDSIEEFLNTWFDAILSDNE